MAEMKYVYTIIERDGLEKSQWIKLGIAFVNKDQSLNLKLDALPMNGTLHIRDRPPKKTTKGEESSVGV